MNYVLYDCDVLLTVNNLGKVKMNTKQELGTQKDKTVWLSGGERGPPVAPLTIICLICFLWEMTFVFRKMGCMLSKAFIYHILNKSCYRWWQGADSVFCFGLFGKEVFNIFRELFHAIDCNLNICAFCYCPLSPHAYPLKMQYIYFCQNVCVCLSAVLAKNISWTSRFWWNSQSDPRMYVYSSLTLMLRWPPQFFNLSQHNNGFASGAKR